MLMLSTDAAHAELRNRTETEAERATENDLTGGGGEHHQRRQLHVAGAAQDSPHRIHHPGHNRAAEENLGVAEGVGQHAAAAAEQFEQRRAENQHAEHERQSEADADQKCVRGQRRCAVDIARTERARDRRRDAAAHRAARHGHGQDHERKHQRHRRQRLHAKPADIGGLRDHHAGPRAERDDVGPGQPQQRAQDRAVKQRIPRQRLRRRKRTLLLVYGYLGDGDVGQFGLSPSARSRCRAAVLPTTIKPESTCAGRNGGLPDCRRNGRLTHWPLVEMPTGTFEIRSSVASLQLGQVIQRSDISADHGTSKTFSSALWQKGQRMALIGSPISC
jgi:hypothetical protein